MANLPVYKRKTTPAVGPTVQETAPTGIAEGVASLASGVVGSVGSITETIGKAVYGQELDDAKIAYSQMADQFAEDMRRDPIMKYDENGRVIINDASLKNIDEDRVKAWEEKSAAFMQEHEGSFSHGRAKTDFDSWAAGQTERMRAEINQNSVTEYLEYAGTVTSQNYKDAMDAGQFDLAASLALDGVERGLYSAATGEEMIIAARNEEVYQGEKNMVLNGYTDENGNEIQGYNDYEDSLDGIQAAYDNIDALNLSPENEKRMYEEINAQHNRQKNIQDQITAREREEGWVEYTSAISNGGYDYNTMRTAIRDDDRIDASLKEHLWRLLDAANAPDDGSMAEKMHSEAAIKAWSNEFLTQDSYITTLRQLEKDGVIDSAQMQYWMAKSRPDAITNPQVRGIIEDTTTYFDDLINEASAKGDADEVNRLTMRKAQAIEYITNGLMDEDIQKTITTEQLMQLRNDANKLAFTGDDLGAGTEARGQAPITDWAKWTRAEKGFYLLSEGGLALSGVSDVAEEISYLEGASIQLLSDQYAGSLKDFRIDPATAGTEDFHVIATSVATGRDVHLKWQTSKENKRIIELRQRDQNGDWPITTIQSDAELEAYDYEYQNREDVLRETRTEEYEASEVTDVFSGEQFQGVPTEWITQPASIISANMAKAGETVTDIAILTGKRDYVASVVNPKNVLGFNRSERAIRNSIRMQLQEVFYPESQIDGAVNMIYRQITR